MVGKSVRLVACTVACAVVLCSVGAVGMAQSIAVRPESAPVVTVSLAANALPLKEALSRIATQAGLQPAFSNEVSRSTARVTVQIHNASVKSAFEQVLRGTGLRAAIVGDNVLFEVMSATSSPVAQGSITGKIVDGKTREGLRGATITLVGTNKGTTSGDDGTFRFPGVVPGNYTLQVRMLGYVKTSQPVAVTEGQTASIKVTLEPSVNALDQVVVTGTVIETERKAVPNSMTVITADDIERRGITKIDQLFRGDVPGMFALSVGSADALDQAVVFSRGATRFGSGTSSPGGATNPIKTYVDGVELVDPSYLSQIDPRSIERIEILTGPQASTIYGSNAINGVMQVFTKRGAGNKPQISATLTSGLVQNNFSTAFTSQHDYSAQVNGVEGHWSYNAGGSWNYMGPWTPNRRTDRRSGFGGANLRRNGVSADVSICLATTQNRSNGANDQPYQVYRATGWWFPTDGLGIIQGAPGRDVLTGQTLGFTIGLTPTSWLSHEIVMGRDVSLRQFQRLRAGYLNPVGGDTLLSISENTAKRQSIRLTSTVRLPIDHERSHVLVTVGADTWNDLSASWGVTSPNLTGTLAGAPRVSRQPGHNTGGFLQGQLGLRDELFVTYGLRAEWNPNFGADAQPNIAPRYGVSYVKDFGQVTAKARVSTGRSTRPPGVGMGSAQSIKDYWASLGGPTIGDAFIDVFGPFDMRLANTDLGPEHQGGWEGGLEMFVGRFGSLVLTRYNQTVDGLIVALAGVDSVRSKLPTTFWGANSFDSEGNGYFRQSQNLNVGSIRNQGWEMQGTLTTGPLTTQGTYSETKSRVIGITPQYRRLLAGSQYQPGASFAFLPEHTWALGLTYARSRSMIAINMAGVGMLVSRGSDFFVSHVGGNIRLQENQARISLPDNFSHRNAGYVLADLNSTYRVTSHVEGLLQIQNLTDYYRNDVEARFAALGRQSKAGIRLRF